MALTFTRLDVNLLAIGSFETSARMDSTFSWIYWCLKQENNIKSGELSSAQSCLTDETLIFQLILCLHTDQDGLNDKITWSDFQKNSN